MENKRKAAANIFMEQQVKQMEETAEEEYVANEQSILPNNDLLANNAPDMAPGMQQMAGSPSPINAEFMQKRAKKPKMLVLNTLKSSEELQLEKEPINVRVTGKLFWRRVIVPPNAYVIHTRINRNKPVTMGLGKSFRYNSNTDAYLVIPAAMQTIGVVANCISKEKQGINILAYVQWQIDDFTVAYKKLDLSDLRDPLGIVNAQLREQAEAAIKDKIATMSVEEVLTDKAPVIEELTNRLKAVTEGRQNTGNAEIDEGLGIKIVTVQIREALVCSTTLWENLQSPFRYEQRQKERISYLTAVNEINSKEMETKQLKEKTETETMVEIERIRQQKQTEALELKLKEETIRFEQEQESLVKRTKMKEMSSIAQKESEERIKLHENQLRIQTELELLKQDDLKKAEQTKLELEAEHRTTVMETEKQIHKYGEEARSELVRIQTEEEKIKSLAELKQKESGYQILVQQEQDRLEETALVSRLKRQETEHRTLFTIEEEKNAAMLAREKKETEIEEIRQKIRNILGDNIIFEKLIEKLPEIAGNMPEISELKILNTGGTDATFDSLVNFLSKIFALAENLGIALPLTDKAKSGKEESKE